MDGWREAEDRSPDSAPSQGDRRGLRRGTTRRRVGCVLIGADPSRREHQRARGVREGLVLAGWRVAYRVDLAKIDRGGVHVRWRVMEGAR
ncbi:hypothetical protein GCM10022214_67480 [Actinomadura miaoliensis]|uniref:Uncharacterized protein n=1 Tax=Actinomadura miaoliensis TaxID=430685 RepID=A0ABP7WRG8_9ACTN